MASPQGSVHGQPQQVGQAGQPIQPSSGSGQSPVSTPLPPGAMPPGAMPPGYTGPVVGHVGGVGGVRRNRAGWREWRRADPTLINSLWKSKMGHGIRSQLGNLHISIAFHLDLK